MNKTSHIFIVFLLIALAMILAACQPAAATETQLVPQTAPTLVTAEAAATAVPATATSAPAAATESQSQSSSGREDYRDEDYGAPSQNKAEATAMPDPAAPTPDPDPVAPGGLAASDEVKLHFQNAGSLGQILVDERGMTLYRFTNDTPNVSNCAGQCAVNWPPLLVAPGGEVEIDDMDEEGLIGTITREDGSIQVTYKGQPLYYWINDTSPGDTTGQNVNGVWFVVNP